MIYTCGLLTEEQIVARASAGDVVKDIPSPAANRAIARSDLVIAVWDTATGQDCLIVKGRRWLHAIERAAKQPRRPNQAPLIALSDIKWGAVTCSDEHVAQALCVIGDGGDG